MSTHRICTQDNFILAPESKTNKPAKIDDIVTKEHSTHSESVSLFLLTEGYYLRYFTDNNFGTLIAGRLIRGGRLIGGRLIDVRLYLTTRFHVVVRPFSYRSKMTPKFGKNKKVAKIR